MKNDALKYHGSKANIYKESEMVNGKKSWKSQHDAIWFIPSSNKWVIGSLSSIGSIYYAIQQVDLVNHEYPYHVDRWSYLKPGFGFVSPYDSANIIIKRVTGIFSVSFL